MRYFVVIVYFLTFLRICDAKIESDNFIHLSEEEQISFYRGYLIWQEYLKRPGMSYDFTQVMAGMHAAEKGEVISCDEKMLRGKIRHFQEALFAKQCKENLEDAEAFLAKLSQEDVVELISKKLYYQVLQCGKGRGVEAENTPLLTYSVRTSNRFGEEELLSIEDPVPISLRETIPGFAQGVMGMCEGEVRKIYIHPDLAYGIHGKVDPNLLIIFEVKLYAVNQS